MQPSSHSPAQQMPGLQSRRLEDHLVRSLANFADRLPLAGRFAPIKNLGAADVLLGETAAHEALGRRMNQSRLTGRYLNARIRLFGRRNATSLIRCELSADFREARRRKTPTLLVAWHAGQLNSLFTGLLRSTPDAAILKSSKVHADLEQVFTVFGTSQSSGNKALENAAQLKRAVGHLRSGGVLLTFLDGTNGSGSLQVPFLKEKISLRQGTTTLARLAGAQVFPCFGRWDSADKRFLFRIGDAVELPELCTADSESTLRCLTRLTAPFAQHLQAYPEDITTETSYLAESTVSDTEKQED